MKFLLYHGDNLVTQGERDRHGYAIYDSSPLGRAMKGVGESRWLLVKDLHTEEGDNGGPYEMLVNMNKSYFIEPILNVGKEWIFRKFFSFGNECIGENTINTHQAYQTRLRRESNGNFKIYTQVSGCKGGDTFAYLVQHDLCFKRSTKESHNDPRINANVIQAMIAKTVCDSMDDAKINASRVPIYEAKTASTAWASAEKRGKMMFNM